jgi:D-alanyl-D-alanine carboxypeptidase (penicillin-binding protein 5/6)
MRARTRLMAAIATTSALTGLAAFPAQAAVAGHGASPSRHGARQPALTAHRALTQSGAAPQDIGGPLMSDRGTVVNYPDRAAPRLPAIPASAYVIANASTGQVLAAKDPHGKFGPASTLKVLTAITLIPRLNPNALVTASKLAAETEPMDAGLVAGRRYKVSDLFTALLTISANDAAVALAQATGSFAKAMVLINAEARHLQADDVVARQPNGLPANGQVESAYDEALIARQALAMPQFMKYDSTLSARFEVKPRDWETLVNQNWLLTKYRGGIGGKIGWTVSSEATYIGLARRHGVTLIVTILHCTALQEITSAVKLLNWGFAMDGKVKPVGVLVPPLASATAAHTSTRIAASARPVAASVSNGPAAAGGDSGYAIAAGAVVAALLGVGGVLRTRRKLAAGRHRE